MGDLDAHSAPVPEDASEVVPLRLFLRVNQDMWEQYRRHQLHQRHLRLVRGSKVQGVGFKVQGVGFKVQGVGFKVQGLGCRV